ncbi:putative 3-hydroxyacyl-CoA dehydrogenase [Aspergillus aurantiobrunneus]
MCPGISFAGCRARTRARVLFHASSRAGVSTSSTLFLYHPLAPSALQDEVIVLTGGANGIGASLTDVASYDSVLNLFDKAMEIYGRIDHAVAGAGIGEIGNVFDPALTMETIRQNSPPTTKVMDVNLLGCLYFARIASVYLRQNRPDPKSDRSILLVSSVAGFKESPGLFVYQAAKHGVLGLMRALRLYLCAPAHGIRVNCICPWMTATAIIKGVQDGWMEAGLPLNSPMDVAKVSAAVLGDVSLNGTSMYVEGGRMWETEANIDRLEAQWLGEEPSQSSARGQARNPRRIKQHEFTQN